MDELDKEDSPISPFDFDLPKDAKDDVKESHAALLNNLNKQSLDIKNEIDLLKEEENKFRT